MLIILIEPAKFKVLCLFIKKCFLILWEVLMAISAMGITWKKHLATSEVHQIEHEGKCLLSWFNKFPADHPFDTEFESSQNFEHFYILYHYVLGMTLNCIWWWGSSLEVYGMWSTPSLSLLSIYLWPRVVVHFRVTSLGQLQLFDHLLRIIIISYLKPYNCWTDRVSSMGWIELFNHLLRIIIISHLELHRGVMAKVIWNHTLGCNG